MAPLQFQEPENNEAPGDVRGPDSNISKPSNRQRWATTRKAGTGGVRKRVSIMDRFHKRSEMRDEKRRSNNGNASDAGSTTVGTAAPEAGTNRTIYFNIPLPESERDEEGHLINTYPRNKIRTAKYTPLTFVPKNIWLQFHNIANIYFLFVIILNVRRYQPSKDYDSME